MICGAVRLRRARLDISKSSARREPPKRHSEATLTTLSDPVTRPGMSTAASGDGPPCRATTSGAQELEVADCRSVNGELSDGDKLTIYEQYRGGTPVETLARRHRTTETLIRRLVTELFVRRILELPLEYIPNAQFDSAEADSRILGEMPVYDHRVEDARVPSGLPPYLARLYRVPLLTREQEGHLFRKFNYLKYKACELRSQLDPAHAELESLKLIENLYQAAVATRNQIVQANLRLVVSLAKRYVSQGDNFFELVSDGNISLMRAVDKFDFARGNKLSTYASWAIIRNFARTIPQELRQRDRFRTGQADFLNASEGLSSDEHGSEIAQRRREGEVRELMERLDEREKQIVVSRFGLDHGGEARTLQEIGVKLGVGKERVRQIEARAMTKLRIAASEESIESLDAS